MTINEIRKYAEEKRLPQKGIEDMCKRLEYEFKDGNVDEMTSVQLCVYIDRQSEYWKGFRNFLDENRKEREKRREERARKGGFQ